MQRFPIYDQANFESSGQQEPDTEYDSPNQAEAAEAIEAPGFAAFEAPGEADDHGEPVQAVERHHDDPAEGVERDHEVPAELAEVLFAQVSYPQAPNLRRYKDAHNGSSNPHSSQQVSTLPAQV
jgi:hypothetical protein